MDSVWIPWRLTAAVRFAVAAAVGTYVLTYQAPPGISVPGYVTPVAIAIVVDLLILAILQVRATTPPRRGMSALYLVADLGSPIALLYLYSFDPRQTLFVLLFVSMAQGALALRLLGALTAWAISSLAYIGLQLNAALEPGDPAAQPLVVGLRVFIMLIIAVVIARLTESFEQGAEARDRAEHSLRYQASLLENVTDAVLATDLEMRITSWNPAAAALYGWPAEEVIGRPLHEVLGSTQIGGGTDLANSQLSDSGSWSGEFMQHRRDGDTVDVEAKGLPLRDDHGTIVGYVTVNREVTERRRALEAQIHASNTEQAGRAKDEFLSRMSHELRTPLNAILGYAQLLTMDDITPDQRAQLEEIMGGGQHLLSLIDEVLDISRIESHRLNLHIEPILAGRVVEEAVGMVSVLAERRGIRLSVEPSDDLVSVMADTHRLRQVLLNLLSNAIKYNRPSGIVSIACGATSEGYVRIAVRDTGPGIAPENLEKAFVPFERLGADRTGIEGTGLGLSLSKNLVEAMGGQIGVDSIQGEGTTFWIHLASADIEALASVEDAEPVRRNPVPAHGRILYIEDNPGNVRLVRSVVARRPDVELLVATHGQMGLDIAQGERPDLILLDVHLPDIPGDEVLRSLRRNTATRSIPVVAISADATEIQRARLRAAGASEYLTKPLDITRLLGVIDTLMGTTGGIGPAWEAHPVG